MNRQIVFLVALFLVLGISIQIHEVFFRNKESEHLSTNVIAARKEIRIIKIAQTNTQLQVLVADSQEERAIGLGGIDSLGECDGMLFVLPTNNRESFWMKDMQFALDFIWISSDGIVLKIEKDITPDSWKIFTTPTPALYVLEVAAGFSQEKGIEIGSKIEI